MRLIVSFAALFLSVVLLQISSGGVGPLDALSGLALGFSTAQVGLLGSAHFVGFFIGCWWAPRLMGSVGHTRAFAAFVLGGALVQYPVGWLADRIDRRRVLIGLSVASVASCGVTVAASDTRTAGVFAAAALFGLTTFPIYSVAAAHAHDWADSHERVELSAKLVVFFALGAIASPLVASALVAAYGPSALFMLIAAGQAVLVVFGFTRMRARPARGPRTPYVWTPRTSFLIGRLTRAKRDRDAP